MRKELSKVYEPQEVEGRIYQQWEENKCFAGIRDAKKLSLIHISEPTRLGMISYAVFCLKKFFLMIRRPPRSTLSPSSAASDVYKRQLQYMPEMCRM